MTAALMARFGSGALFVFTGAMHLLLLLFLMGRLGQTPRPPVDERSDFVAMPTSATAGLDLDPRALDLGQDSQAESELDAWTLDGQEAAESDRF